MLTTRSLLLSMVTALGLAAPALATGCSSAPGESPAASTAEPILGGTPVANDTLAQVYICNGYDATTNKCTGYICSGTMIADQWMLTAHHCATTPPVQTGGTQTPAKQMTIGFPGAANTFFNAEVYLHPTADIALVHTDYSVLNSANAVETIPMWTGSSASLQGQQLLAEGFGYTNISNSGWTWGDLRSATLTVAQASTGYLLFDPNGAGQSVYGGDSGGASILPSINKVVGVHSYSNYANGIPVGAPTSTVDVGVDAVYSWVEGTITANGCTPKTEEQACLVAPPGGGILRHYCGAEVNQPNGCGGSINCGRCAKGHPCLGGLCTLAY